MSLHELPDPLPVPEDDGACDHLPGMRLPGLELPATDGTAVDLQSLTGRTVLYPLSRANFRLAGALRLPTFALRGRRFFKRVTRIAEGGAIHKALCPVFPPDQTAADVSAWLRTNP